jgi:hypothetical protein
MGTRGYGYNQIRVHIHIIMGSQIPVYYTRGCPFTYPPRARDGFYLRVPVSMVFLPPVVSLVVRVVVRVIHFWNLGVSP